MHALGIVIFGITYVLIAARRLSIAGLDRPAAAMMGAVACVALGVLTPTEALDAVDGPTLLLLFGVMGMGAFLALDGFFDALEPHLVARAKTPTRLLGMVVWGAGLLSALITNDAVCVLGAPLVVRLVQRHRLPALPFLLALATGANTGSVATLVGNPQNMLCGILGELSYLDFATRMVPVAVVGLALNHGLLRLLFGRELGAASLAPATATAPLRGRHHATLAVIVLTAVGYGLGLPLAWTAVGGLAILMLLHRRDARELWPRIDWALLLFFAGLFVVVEGLVASGAPAWVFARFPLAELVAGPFGEAQLAALFLVGSNVVSNVPFILVVAEPMRGLPDPTLGWQLLAMASTFAGNLTLLGSVANIIVAEAGRDVGGLGFIAHLRVGAPIALVTTLAGTAWLWWLAG
ncbi:MAG: SLC13 family permease [Sandaracinaceae bacterium]